MQTLYIMTVVVLYANVMGITWSWTKQGTSEDVKTSLSEKQKPTQLCMEAFKEKHTKVIENSIRNKSTLKTSVRFVKKMRGKPIFRTKKVNFMRYVYNSSTEKHGKKYLKYLRLFSCHFPYSEYKSLTHRGNCTKYKPCNDIEKNRLVLLCTMWIPVKQ